jgi:hypothetical protein
MRTVLLAIFKSNLSPDYLKAYLKRLPDFEDDEEKARAFQYAAQIDSFHSGLFFLIQWPALPEAAAMILARHKEMDGDPYAYLTNAAELLGDAYPLAATLILRSIMCG